jgi:HK97 family phage major capsid protein
MPKRISGSTVISRQLVYQSSPDIEAFIAGDISTAIGVTVDNAAINGTGTAPQPLGILHYPVNASGSYAYDHSLNLNNVRRSDYLAERPSVRESLGARVNCE